jgi:competence protein ComEC
VAGEVEEGPAAARLLIPFTLGWLGGGLHHVGAIGAPLAVVGLLGALTIRRHPRPGAAITLAGIAAGISCGALASVVVYAPPPPDDVARLVGAYVVAVEGTIVRSERSGPRVMATLRAERVRSARRSGAASGFVGLTIANAKRDWPRGTRIRVVGKLRRPRTFGNPGAWDHAAAQRRQGVRATVFLWDERTLTELAASSDVVDHTRDAFADWIAHRTTEPARGYLTAVLLGATRSLEPDTRAHLTRTGLAHVVSVSGFHVAVAAGAFVVALRWLLLRLGPLALRIDVRSVAAMAGLAPVAAYAAIAGGTVPATRSFLTYGILVLVLIGRRPPDGFRALALVALLLACGTPDVAADVSFELSFMAVAGLLALAMHMRRRRDDRRPAGGTRIAWWRTLVVAPITTALVASTATAPLTAWHFQQVSLIAPLANLLTLPLLGPATLVPGLIALPLVTLAPRVADVLLFVANAAASAGLALAARLAAIPGAAVSTPMPNLLEVTLCYGWLAWLWWRLRGPADHRPRRLVTALLAVVTFADLGYWVWERRFNPDLRVTFLAVGQGDAAVVELPRGGVMVIDGGGLPGDFDPGERVIAPFLRSRKILRVDVLVLSHPQLDHFGGLAHLAEQFAPAELWSNGTRSASAAFARLETALFTSGVRRVVLRRGMERTLGDVRMEILHPTSADGLGVNDASLVLRLVYDETAVLFTGDIEHVAEAEMLHVGRVPATEVLKVAHHGSATSSTGAWLAAVRPRIAVVSTGEGNRFGFPAPSVVRRLHATGARVWNTAEHGAVRVVSDGRHVAARAFRAARAETRFEMSKSLW